MFFGKEVVRNDLYVYKILSVYKILYGNAFYICVILLSYNESMFLSGGTTL